MKHVEYSYGMDKEVERKRTVIEVSKITFTKSKSSGWRLRETNCKAKPELVFTRLPVLRQRELYPGLVAEQEKLPIDGKRKGRKP